MNVQLPKEYKVRKRDIVIYTICIIICVVALTIVVTMQVLGEGITNKVFHTNKLQIASEEEQLKLRTDFENMFTNKIEGKIENVEKKDESKDIIFTVYENEDNISENYTLNVHIPNFNIKDENIEELNNKISTEYKQKVNQILNNKGNQIIYSVEYSAYIENEIIFLIIRSNLKESNNAQKQMVYTYNYDLKNKKEITLENIIEKLKYNKNDVQKAIQNYIEEQEKNSKSLKNLGYGIYVRNSKDEMYKIENTKNFFVKNNKIYIIYPYGNTSATSEMDASSAAYAAGCCNCCTC